MRDLRTTKIGAALEDAARRAWRRVKASPSLFALAQPVHERMLLRRYRSTVEHYSRTTPPGSFDDLLEARAGDRLARLRSLKRPLRIFYLGFDEQRDTAGILQAVGRLGELAVFRRSDGTYGQDIRGCRPISREPNSRRLWDLVCQLADKDRAPDLLIGEMVAEVNDGEVLDRIRRRFGTIIVNIAQDDRSQFGFSRVWPSRSGPLGILPSFDVALTAAPECVDWYLKEGCAALFFPEASDPELFKPLPELPKIHDVSFVGQRYGVRREIVETLLRAGVRVTSYGNGWPLGSIPTADVPRLFAQSKIILGVGTVVHCRSLFNLKTRDFDATMSGSLYLTSDNPDLRALFDVGRELVCYRDAADCAEKALYFLAHEEERERIAHTGRKRAEREHAWLIRFTRLFESLGLPAATGSTI